MAENNKSHADLRGNIFSILKEYTCINHLLIMLIFFQSHSETELSKVLHMKTKKKKKNLTTDHQVSCQEFANQKKLKHSDLTHRV